MRRANHNVDRIARFLTKSKRYGVFGRRLPRQSVVLTVLKTWVMPDPTACIATTVASMTSATINPYSMAVTPRRSLHNARRPRPARGAYFKRIAQWLSIRTCYRTPVKIYLIPARQFIDSIRQVAGWYKALIARAAAPPTPRAALFSRAAAPPTPRAYQSAFSRIGITPISPARLPATPR